MGAPLYAELRCWPELAGLLADGRFRTPARARQRAPVLLIPGLFDLYGEQLQLDVVTCFAGARSPAGVSASSAAEATRG